MKRLAPFFLIFPLTCCQTDAEVKYKLNADTMEYNRLECRWAVKCTKNCIELNLEEIKKRGRVPCKVCKPKA